MDKLLCLLEKYRCHLNRGNKSSVDFLRDNYSEYISDVKAALSPEDNQLVGAEMCKMVSEQIDTIEKNASLLIEVLELYYIIRGGLFRLHKKPLKYLKI